MDKQRRLTTAEIDAQIPAARAREARAREAGLRAMSARYDTAERRVVMDLSNGYVFGFPVQVIPELSGATPKQLAAVDVNPSGSGLRWEELDVDLSVPGLLLSAMPPDQRSRELARIAGRARSRAKSLASRENGKKGGRPRVKP